MKPTTIVLAVILSAMSLTSPADCSVCLLLKPHKNSHLISALIHTPASASLAVPRPPAKSPLEQERRCASALLDYEYLLKHRQQQFAPSHDADKWDERFVSATHSLPQVSYLIDCLYDADAALRKQTADSLLNDGTLHKIEKWNIAHRKEVLPCEENDTLAA